MNNNHNKFFSSLINFLKNDEDTHKERKKVKNSFKNN